MAYKKHDNYIKRIHRNMLAYGLQLAQPMYPSIMIGRANEKDQLSSLNTRFQSYIQKVRFLEEQNKKLEHKIKERTKKSTEVKVKPEDIEEISRLREDLDELSLVRRKTFNLAFYKIFICFLETGFSCHKSKTPSGA